jgi:hypothetical protein
LGSKEWSKHHTAVSKPTTIRGVTYSSRWQAAKALGITPQNVYTAARDGWLDRVGLKTKARKHEHLTDHQDRNDKPTGEETNADC